MNSGYRQPPLWKALFQALAAVAAGVALRSLLPASIGRSAPFLTFYPAVMLAALLAGRTAGFVATALSAAVCYYWIGNGALSTGEALATVFFILSCLMISHICETMRIAQARAARVEAAEKSNRELRDAAAERERAYSEARRLSAIVESSEDCIISKDLSSVVLSWNHGAEKIFGYSAQEMVGTSIKRIIPVERQAEEDWILATICRGESVGHFETVRQRKDGQRIDVSVTASPIRDARGAIIGASKVARDITERKRAEMRLRTSDIALRAVSQGMLIGGPDGLITSANPAFTAITGYTEAEMLGRTCGHLRGPRSDPETCMRIRNALSHKAEFSGEIINYRKDGTAFYNELSLSPVFDAAGQLAHYVGITRDVTPRRMAEEALKVSEQRFRAYVEQAADALFVHDERGRFLEVNRQACASLGYSREELLGMSVADVETEVDLAAAERIWKAIEPGVPITVSGRQRRRDGSTFPVEVRFGCFAIEGERRYLGLVRDTSERERAEGERELLNRKLQEAQKLESLGVLAGGVAHDFNNILTAIVANVSLAGSELPQGAAAQARLTAIMAASRRAADLCRQMLAYSGRGRFEVANVDLNALVQETAHLLEVSIGKQNSLRLHLEPNLPPVHADATQIRQVVMNLVINASEAIGAHGGVIGLRTGVAQVDRAYLNALAVTPEPSEGAYVTLEVSDTGCGMSTETQARIFEPFFTTKFTGRGLGLAAVLGIVRGHKGSLKIYSELGQGTTFKLLFPLAPEGTQPSPRPVPAHPPWEGGGIALIADDEEPVRAAADEILRTLGFTSALAHDGRDAVEIFRAAPHRFSLVLLDLTMPHKGGEAAFAEIQRMRGDVRVILMSGFDERDATARFAGKGLASFLQKPFSADDLARVVREAFCRG